MIALGVPTVVKDGAGQQLMLHDMSDNPRDDGSEWTPATSEPGENYTPMGQIRSIGAFSRGLKNRDPRLRSYRRSMRRSAAIACGGVALVGGAAALAIAIFN